MPRRLLVPLVLAAVVTGCGSSKSEIKVGPASGPVPPAKEPLSGLVKRLAAVQASLQAGRCAPVNAFNRNSGFGFLCNPRGKQAYKGFKVGASAEYGTGGVIEFTDAEVRKSPRQTPAPGVHPRGARAVGALPAALFATGRYELTGPVAQILPGSVIGTKPVNFGGADANAVTFLKSIRDNDCSTFYANSITPRGLTKKQVCEQGLKRAYGELHKQLTSGKKVILFRQGGNAQFYFYGVRTGDQFRTLLIGKARPPAPPFLTFGTTKATK